MATIPESTTTDEVLKEVHRIKDQLGKEYDYNVQRMVVDLQKQEKASGRVIVQAPIRKKLK